MNFARKKFKVVRARNKVDGYNPIGKIHRASRDGDVARVRHLLATGKFQVNDTDKKNRTPLHYACAYGQAEVVAFLLQKKCTIHIFDSDNNTPLTKAIKQQEEECVDLLLENGADPNFQDPNGNTPLHHAVYCNSTSMAVKLLSHKANIEAPNKEGHTPLLLALTENKPQIAEFLLQMKANIHAVDKRGRTSLMLAVRHESENIVKRLLQEGVDVFAEDLSGANAVHCSIASGCNTKLILDYAKTRPKTLQNIQPEEKSEDDPVTRVSDKPGPGDPYPKTYDENDHSDTKNATKDKEELCEDVLQTMEDAICDTGKPEDTTLLHKIGTPCEKKDTLDITPVEQVQTKSFYAPSFYSPNSKDKEEFCEDVQQLRKDEIKRGTGKPEDTTLHNKIGADRRKKNTREITLVEPIRIKSSYPSLYLSNSKGKNTCVTYGVSSVKHSPICLPGSVTGPYSEAEALIAMIDSASTKPVGEKDEKTLKTVPLTEVKPEECPSTSNDAEYRQSQNISESLPKKVIAHSSQNVSGDAYRRGTCGVCGHVEGVAPTCSHKNGSINFTLAKQEDTRKVTGPLSHLVTLEQYRSIFKASVSMTDSLLMKSDDMEDERLHKSAEPLSNVKLVEWSETTDDDENCPVQNISEQLSKKVIVQSSLKESGDAGQRGKQEGQGHGEGVLLTSSHQKGSINVTLTLPEHIRNIIAPLSLMGSLDIFSDRKPTIRMKDSLPIKSFGMKDVTAPRTAEPLSEVRPEERSEAADHNENDQSQKISENLPQKCVSDISGNAYHMTKHTVQGLIEVKPLLDGKPQEWSETTDDEENKQLQHISENPPKKSIAHSFQNVSGHSCQRGKHGVPGLVEGSQETYSDRKPPMKRKGSLPLKSVGMKDKRILKSDPHIDATPEEWPEAPDVAENSQPQVKVKRKMYKINRQKVSLTLCDGDEHTDGDAGELIPPRKCRYADLQWFSPQETKEHDGSTRRTSTRKGKVEKQIHAMEDLDDLAQSSEASLQESEVAYCKHKRILLIEQPKKLYKDSGSLVNIQNTATSYQGLTEHKEHYCSHCVLLLKTFDQLKYKCCGIKEVLIKEKLEKTELEKEKAKWNQDIHNLRFALKEKKERRTKFVDFIKNLKERFRERKEKPKKKLQFNKQLGISLGNELRSERSNLKLVTTRTEAEIEQLHKYHIFQDEMYKINLHVDTIKRKHEERKKTFLEDIEILKKMNADIQSSIILSEETFNKTLFHYKEQIKNLNAEKTMCPFPRAHGKQNTERLEKDIEARLPTTAYHHGEIHSTKRKLITPFQRRNDECVVLKKKDYINISNLNDGGVILSQNVSKSGIKVSSQESELWSTKIPVLKSDITPRNCSVQEKEPRYQVERIQENEYTDKEKSIEERLHQLENENNLLQLEWHGVCKHINREVVLSIENKFKIIKGVLDETEESRVMQRNRYMEAVNRNHYLKELIYGRGEEKFESEVSNLIQGFV